MTAPQLSIKDLRRVVIAAAVGNVIEWYDFYIFGSLAAILSVQFFSKTDPVAAFLSTVAIFSVGFLIRPLGAFVFGRIGDLVGRKYTFLITLSGMGLSTALIGVVPSYARIGLTAAILLFILRLIQGLCLGGEYGGAITYVAEHVPDAKRGYYTGWLQTSPTLGIVVSLAVIIGTREIVGTEAWAAWGWRIPFLLSLLMVAIAIYIRLRLQETPIFQDMKAKGQTAMNPWREAFLSENFKYVVIASIVVLGEGCVWYSGQFWALYFLQQVRKPDVLTPAIITGIALLIATPTLILFGWLSDKIGRKPIILGGFALAAQTERKDKLQQVLELSDLRYRSGYSPYLEVLDSQRQLLQAQTLQIVAARNVRLAVIDVAKALGGGWDYQTAVQPPTSLVGAGSGIKR